MTANSSAGECSEQSLEASFERYLQDKGKGPVGTVGTIDETLDASSGGSPSGPPATEATTGPVSFPTMMTENQPLATLTNACFGSTPAT